MTHTRRSQRKLGALLLAITSAAACANPSSTAEPPALVFTHVTVLPMTADPSTEGPRALLDQIVVVEGEVITALGDSMAVSAPEGAVVVDASGMFMMPGLIDMHVRPPPVWWTPTMRQNRKRSPRDETKEETNIHRRVQG